MPESRATLSVLFFATLSLLLLTGCPDDGVNPGGDGGPAGDVQPDGEAVDAAEDTQSGDTADDEDTGGPDAASDAADDATGETGAEDAASDASGDATADAAADTISDTTSSDTTSSDTTSSDATTSDATTSDTNLDTSAGGDTAGQDGGQNGGTDAASATCGGIAGKTCGSGQWCDYANDSCGAADQLGTCKPRPQGCTKQYDPVCGCDGQTYGNQCMAEAAGVDVQHEGKCKTVSGCGPNAGSCGPREYCDFPDDKCGKGQNGACKQRPQFCPAVYMPVCGCDGQTYGNSCKAASKGTDYASMGKCSP